MKRRQSSHARGPGARPRSPRARAPWRSASRPPPSPSSPTHLRRNASLGIESRLPPKLVTFKEREESLPRVEKKRGAGVRRRAAVAAAEAAGQRCRRADRWWRTRREVARFHMAGRWRQRQHERTVEMVVTG